MSTQFDDKELFQEALTDEPAAQAAPEQQQETVTVDEAQARDERGRFASQEAEAQVEEPKPEAQPDDGDKPVPGKRFGEVTRARDEAIRRAEEAERRAQESEARVRAIEAQQRAPVPPQQQQDQPQVDLVDALLTDPDGFLRNRDAQNMQAIGVTLVDMQPGGREARGAAYQALTQLQATNPHAFQAASATIFSAPPLQQAQALVEWHKSFQAQQRVGSDPEAFFTRTLEERLSSDPEFAKSLVEKLTGQARQQPQGSNGQPVVQLPPSLSRATSAAPSTGPAFGEMTDAALFADALR